MVSWFEGYVYRAREGAYVVSESVMGPSAESDDPCYWPSPSLYTGGLGGAGRL